MNMTLADIDEALSSIGLLTLGAFHPRATDQVPGGGDGCTVVLVGNAGPDMWRVFSSSGIAKDDPAPLDDWSRRVLSKLSAALSDRFDLAIQALFPFEGPPYHPFQRWAVRSGTVHPSPIGPMIHGTYGLWHAYRGAFVVASTLTLDPIPATASPCQSCAEQPCLTRCPVGAFSAEGYDVPACLDLLEKQPDGDCLSASCLARRACPIGRAYVYDRPQARFHMEKFLKAHRR